MAPEALRVDGVYVDLRMARALGLGPYPALALLGDPLPTRVPVGRSALDAISGRLRLPRRDPRVGGLRCHTLAYKARSGGSPTGLVDALRG